MNILIHINVKINVLMLKLGNGQHYQMRTPRKETVGKVPALGKYTFSPLPKRLTLSLLLLLFFSSW